MQDGGKDALYKIRRQEPGYDVHHGFHGSPGKHCGGTIGVFVEGINLSGIGFSKAETAIGGRPPYPPSSMKDTCSRLS